MKNLFNINKEIGEIKNNYEDQGGTPYISISDSSNMQVESSHFSLNNKNSLSCINNQQNLGNQNNNNNLIFSNNGSLSLSKSIINNNINISHNNNNNSGIQVSFENVSLSGSNKLQISSNSIIFKKNDISKNSIFLSPSTLCNYYQQSNDVTPYKSPLIKQVEHEHELIHENDQSSGKEMHKLKQINIDILHKRKSIGGSNNKSMNKNINNINSNLNNNNNNGEITSRSEECEPSLDNNNKTLSSQRKYVFDKKTPIKYAKNQLKSGEKNKSSKSNNSKLENNNSNSNISDNKTNHLEEDKNKKNKGITIIQNKNGRNLMDTFEKVGNGKENDDNLKFFNNRRQPTEIHLTSEEFKMNANNNFDMNDGNNNFNKKFIDRLDDDSSFNEKDSKLNNDNEDINFLDKIKNNLKKEKNEEKNNFNSINDNNNYNFKVEKGVEKKKDEVINKENKDNKENIIINNNKEGKEISSIPIKKEDIKKICIKKILPIKKDNNNITELSKNIIKELSRTNLSKRKESRTKSRPSSFTKNIIINFNSFNSIGVNNNNIDNNIGFKNKKKSNILVKKNKYVNEFKNTNEIFERKPTKMKLISKENKQNNNTIEPLQIRRKIKIPNRLGKKEKNSKETSINSITNNIRERKRPPSSENYNRRATSFSNLKQTMNSNLFHNNNNNNNKIVVKKNSNSNNSSGQKNINKNQFKKQKPLIVNLFVEEDSRHNQKNINVQISHHNNNNINNKNNQQEISHKVVRKKMKPLLTKKEMANVNANSNSIINNVKYISNATTNNNACINDRNYQTVSSVSRNTLDIKLRHKLNEKKDNEDILKKKDINKDNKSSSFYNNDINNYNNINYENIPNNNNNNMINNVQFKKKEEPKVKIIQNFSSYHKIKYKSHIPEKINFAETQPKQLGIAGEGFYNCNKNNIPIKENKKQNNNSSQYGGGNCGNIFQNYNNDIKNKNNVIKQVKFRKLEKLPGDSDSGDVVLNDDCI